MIDWDTELKNKVKILKRFLKSDLDLRQPTESLAERIAKEGLSTRLLPNELLAAAFRRTETPPSIDQLLGFNPEERRPLLEKLSSKQSRLIAMGIAVFNLTGSTPFESRQRSLYLIDLLLDRYKDAFLEENPLKLREPLPRRGRPRKDLLIPPGQQE